MHGRMAKYTVSGDVHELARTAEEGMLPIFKSQPGFKAYSLMESGNEIISFSAWESAEDAEAASTVGRLVDRGEPGRSDHARGSGDRRDPVLDDARREHEGRRHAPEIRHR